MTIPFQNQVKNQRQEISTKLQKMKQNENKNEKQKQMTKQNVFWAFEFYKKEELEETKNTIQLPSQTTLNFKHNFKNAPNLIVPLSSKIYMSKRRQETQSLSLEE